MAPEDAVVAETLAWVDISNLVVIESQRSILVQSLEPQVRAELLMEAATERVALTAAFGALIRQEVLGYRNTLNGVQQELQKARSELLALPARMEAKEKALMTELHARYEQKAAELEEGGHKLSDARAKLQAEVVDLSRRRDEELSALSNFRSESDDRRKRLHDQKVVAAEEMQELEKQLEVLRGKVSAEKVLLDSLSEEEAVKRKKLEVLSDMGALPPRQLATAPSPTRSATIQQGGDDSTPSSVHRGGAGQYVPMGSTANASSTKLDFGISTLQSVRDQLREIRESSLSPIRRHDSESVATPRQTTTAHAASDDEPTSAKVPQSMSTTTFGSASYTSFSSPTVNPWKERLRQLQGDLQLLRADLGAR